MGRGRCQYWWSNVIKAVKTLTTRNFDKVVNIKSIGVSGMVPAIVLLDENGNPVRNTMQQNDARAMAKLKKLKRN